MNLLRAASTVSLLTLASRITGLVNQMIQAALFGAGAWMDAYNVAFRIPNLLRRLFAEGAFSQAFVPLLAATRAKDGDAATRDLVKEVVVEGLSSPVTPRDYVSIHIDPTRCIGCGMCEMVCETEAYWARGEKASVRKLRNYECTRDHACARNCPTDAISLGNL